MLRPPIIRSTSLITVMMLAALVLVVSDVHSAEESGRFKFTTGLDISWGDYGETQETEMVYFPFSIKYGKFPWFLRASFSYLNIEGPATVVGGIDGGEIIDSGNNERRTAYGPGDIILSGGYALDTLLDTNLYLDLIAKVKLPYADEDEGLGTGEEDYQLQLDVASVHGAYTPLGTIGYKWPGYPGLDDQTLASLGMDYKLSDTENVGGFFDYRTASSPNSEPLREVMIYFNHKISPNYAINTYAIAGFSDSSLNRGAGIQFSIYH